MIWIGRVLGYDGMDCMVAGSLRLPDSSDFLHLAAQSIFEQAWQQNGDGFLTNFTLLDITDLNTSLEHKNSKHEQWMNSRMNHKSIEE